MAQNVRADFATRLHELCDDMQLPPERGRQSRLAAIFRVTPNAARKWLNGEGMPELETAIEIANWADANVTWLLQGTGPKRGDRVDTKALVLNEAIEALPAEAGQQVMDFIKYKIERADGPISGERLARYMTMLDAFARDMKGKRASR